METYLTLLFVLVCVLFLLTIVLVVSGLYAQIFGNSFPKKSRRLLETTTNLNRGNESELRLILNLLQRGVSSKFIFHDLYIKKSEDEYSQIDAIVVSKRGILVFEVKNYKGWIFGNGNHTHWTQVLAYGNKKYRFYNPIKQNNNHIKYLRKVLKLPTSFPFYSIIVFDGNCELKEINYVPECTYLIKPYRINEVLQLIKENSEIHYNNIDSIIQLLNEAVALGEDIEISKTHAKNIQNTLGKNRILD